MVNIVGMTVLTRKQRQLKEREARILEVSRPMVIAEGYHGISMDRIADRLEYSKGTIYNHFACKEEIIIALAIETMEKRLSMFERAAGFNGIPRERLTAVAMAAEYFVRLYPDHFKLECILRSESIWEKTSELRQNLLRSCETRCMSIVGGLIRDGIAQKCVCLPDEMTPEELVFGLWSMTTGAFTIICSSEPLVELGIKSPFFQVRRHLQTMLDGYGFTPLSTDHDYVAIVERINTEVFPNESKRASIESP
jgi:AcrR family transcriptional regulator